MDDEELRLAAGALLAEIDNYARAIDNYEYGLPLDVEHMAELVAIVRPYLAGHHADAVGPAPPPVPERERVAQLIYEAVGRFCHPWDRKTLSREFYLAAAAAVIADRAKE